MNDSLTSIKEEVQERDKECNQCMVNGTVIFKNNFVVEIEKHGNIHKMLIEYTGQKERAFLNFEIKYCLKCGRKLGE